jgi:predicted RNA-binding protein
MCESTAYILKNGTEELFFEDVDALENKNNEIKLVNIFGETKKISAKIKLFSLVDHKILLEPC